MRDAALQSLAVGFFDGVHLGHQAILKGADAALTFRNHPLAVLAPERAPRLIMTCEERVAAIKACGVKDDGAFELKASKGVIVRALAQDMGATLMSLRRTKVGKFDVADAIAFDKLLETEMKDFASFVMPLSVALK